MVLILEAAVILAASYLHPVRLEEVDATEARVSVCSPEKTRLIFWAVPAQRYCESSTTMLGSASVNTSDLL